MTKYNIEGNIDFFYELYNSLDIKEDEFKTEEDEKKCLITNEPLKDNYIKLICGHMFNYIPLYNDIKNHKNKFNYLEGKTSHLNCDEIRCPYCRNKQKELLPYYEELGLAKIHGVNFIDPNKKKHFLNKTKECEYLIVNKNYDPNKPIDDNTNSNYFKCESYGYYKISQFIEGYQGEEQNFCCLHKNKKIREHNLKIKNKLKNDAKKEKEYIKIMAKEEAKKIKDEIQKKKRETKNKKLEDKKINKIDVNSLSENIVLGEINITNIGCIEILKSGSKKGSQCGCKVYDEFNCKRHIKNKIQEL
jgi:hypothetical protein